MSYYSRDRYPPYLYGNDYLTGSSLGIAQDKNSGGLASSTNSGGSNTSTNAGALQDTITSGGGLGSAMMTKVSSAVSLLNLSSPTASSTLGYGNVSLAAGMRYQRRQKRSSLLGTTDETIAEDEPATAGSGMMPSMSAASFVTTKRSTSYLLLNSGTAGPSKCTRTENLQVQMLLFPSQRRPQYFPPYYAFQSTPHPPTWRLKDRMKTVGVCLILALNIGTDPPDVHKPSPCAKLHAWFDPTTISRSKAREKIGELLELQYAKWQQRSKLRYRRALDPTLEDVRSLCGSMRRFAKSERILFHYNGHGVPRPTADGELWLFDQNHTQYIPVSVHEIKECLGRPSIIVLDCSGAGVLLPHFVNDWTDAMEVPYAPYSGGLPASPRPPTNLQEEEAYLEWAANAVRDFIVFCPCSKDQLLPMNPEYPADIFTSCLTTPIPIALRWFIRKNPLSMEGIDPDAVADMIPGELNDRKTPLGELNWIFIAITDTIAWNVLPSPLFQRLFRQDLLVASLFRNFLLADRILRSLKCTPMSYPVLPPTWNNPLWEAWDLAVETCLLQLLRSGYLGADPQFRGLSPDSSTATLSDAAATASKNEPDLDPNLDNPSMRSPGQSEDQATVKAPASTINEKDLTTVELKVSSPFFTEQLTAFELWVEFAACRYKNYYGLIFPDPATQSSDPLKFLHLSALEMKPPEQLPVVLQVLLSQAHRVRALSLLRRFLDLGPYAVNMALSVGIFPYVLKLLQSPIDEYKHVLVGIWAKVLAFDPSCQADLLKDHAITHFIKHLHWGLPLGGSTTPEANKVDNGKQKGRSHSDDSEQRTMAAFILSVSCYEYPNAQEECLNHSMHVTMGKLLLASELEEEERQDKSLKAEPLNPPSFSSEFKLWMCIALGNVCQNNRAAQAELYSQDIHSRLTIALNDSSPQVRSAACYALGMLIGTQRQSSLALKTSPSSLRLSGGSMFPSPSSSAGSAGMHASPTRLLGGDAVDGIHLPFQNLPLTPRREDLAPESDTAFAPEDLACLKSDLVVARELERACCDASPLVRYEATTALASFVEKYSSLFASISNHVVPKLPEELTSDEKKSMSGREKAELYGHPDEMEGEGGIAGLGPSLRGNLQRLWKLLLYVEGRDPFVSVAGIAKSIVAMVQDKVLEKQSNHSRIKSLGNMSNAGSPEKYAPVESEAPHSMNESDRRKSDIVPQTKRQDLFLTEDFSRKTELGDASCLSRLATSRCTLARSKYYLWMNARFRENIRDVPCEGDKYYDSLSSEGEIRAYREVRNTRMKQHGFALAARYDVLSPKSLENNMRWQQSSSGIADEDDLFGDLKNEEEIAAARLLEDEIARRKKSLQMKQVTVIHNNEAEMSTMLKFHSYEPALVACDGSDILSVWNIQSGIKSCSFHNQNKKGSRMTSFTWMNEESHSFLVTGADDGTVRIWEGLVGEDGSLENCKPSLVSSYFTAPNLVPKKNESGLVMEWQQQYGRLLIGGSSPVIRYWDVEAEKCQNEILRDSETCVTALTTAWDSVLLGSDEKIYTGASPHLLVAGYGDGIMRVFDVRVKNAVSDSRNAAWKKGKVGRYGEHKSWIVDMTFTSFGGRHEVMSGCMSGEIKFWDLRMSSSLRTIDVQRSQMTAFAGHSRVPIIATGSHDQFIKLLATDGDTLNVMRYHEVFSGSGQRIGPVSCLAFHPHKMLLAAGFTDEFVSIYSPKGTL